MITCTDFEDLSGAYVLDALTSNERKEVDEHLAECPRCMHLFKELQSVVDVLPLSVSQVSPTPQLLDRVLATIDAKPAAQSIRRMRPRGSAWQGWSTKLIAAAALILCLISGSLSVWNVSLQHQLADLKENNALLQKNVGNLAALTYSIKGTFVQPDAVGMLTYLPLQNISVLVMNGLLPAEGNHVYQAWLSQGDYSTSVGVLSVKGDVATIDFKGDLRRYDTVAVSLEDGPKETLLRKGALVAIAMLNNAPKS